MKLPRYSLRTMLITVAIVAAVVGYIAQQARIVAERRVLALADWPVTLATISELVGHHPGHLNPISLRGRGRQLFQPTVGWGMDCLACDQPFGNLDPGVCDVNR